ncbi:hypothetical protein [Clostridium guangxiense]|nr:hypothetical protein [Clostridium guangxiense]
MIQKLECGFRGGKIRGERVWERWGCFLLRNIDRENLNRFSKD